MAIFNSKLLNYQRVNVFADVEKTRGNPSVKGSTFLLVVSTFVSYFFYSMVL